MKCLTICQPWAWCIVHGPKRYENRRWRCSHRGPLLIHAGRSRRWMVPEVLDSLRRRGLDPPAPDDFVYGAIVGLCQVVDCVRPEDTRNDEWAAGPWCIKIADVSPVDPPIPHQGRRGLYDVPQEVVQLLQRNP